MAEDGGDLVDLTVVVGRLKDVPNSFGKGAVANLVLGCGWAVVACICGHANSTCGNGVTVETVFIGVGEPNGNPIGVFVKIGLTFSREGVALNEQTHVGQALTVVGHGYLAVHFCTGVVLQDLNQRVGLWDP